MDLADQDLRTITINIISILKDFKENMSITEREMGDKKNLVEHLKMKCNIFKIKILLNGINHR